MGTRLDDASDLNPWSLVNETWNLSESFDIANNFPSIDVWQSKLSSNELNLSFRHKRVGDKIAAPGNSAKNSAFLPEKASPCHSPSEINHGHDARSSNDDGSSSKDRYIAVSSFCDSNYPTLLSKFLSLNR